ncbi:MAG: SRPBCC family protein [Bryobacteraceae bacterium]|nr:SRPBCC family protein [Bryobacteraceae bacterium]
MIVWILGGLAATVVLGAVVLTAMSMRPGAGQMVSSIEIAATPERLWPWLSDGDKALKWVSWLVEVRPVSKDKEIWVMEDKNNGGQKMEIEGTLVKSDFPRSMTVHLKAEGGFEGDQTYELTSLGENRTKLVVTSQFRYLQAFARLMEPVITPSASKKLQEDLDKLKSAVEREAMALR